MRCERVQFLYDDYSQGTLPLATLGRVEEHLAACPVCREFYEQSDAISRLIREHSEVAHPGPQYFDDLHSRVLNSLAQPATEAEPDPAEFGDLPSSQWRRPLWWIGGVAAAVLFGMALTPLMHNFSGAPDAPVAMVTPDPLPSQNPPAAGQSYNKSVTSTDPISIEEMLGSIPQHVDDERDDPTPAEIQATQEAQARLASIRQIAVENSTLPPEVYKQLQVLKTQIIDGGNEDLRRSLRELEKLVDPRVSDQVKLGAIPLVKQANLYLAANQSLTAGRIDDAMCKYRQILFVDDHSPVAIKATLQMADLFYSELGNFSEAREYYQRCLDPASKGVLSSTETSLIKNHLDRLERYKENAWQPLELLHKIHHGKWDEVLAAMNGLTALAGTDALLPEAARTIQQRMESGGEAPASKITMGLYNLLEKRAGVEQNVDVRAWLELVLGDLAFTQFRDTRQANAHYMKAASAGKSDATVQARAKLDQMLDKNLTGLVRNRKK